MPLPLLLVPLLLGLAPGANAQSILLGPVYRGPIAPRVLMCQVAGLSLTRFPVDGTNGRSWFINNYVDLTPGSGRSDYTGATDGAARTYEGHDGVDIDIPSFREMDSNAAVVRAAAEGVVEAVGDGNFDRNVMATGLPWNFVTIRHPNGFATVYGHLKNGSVSVAVGRRVAAGEVLGVVGSSGNSTAAHLHFEVQDCTGATLSPFANGMWTDPVAYAPRSDVMDVMLKLGAFSGANEVKDPPPDLELIAPGQILGVGLSLAAAPDDDVKLRFVPPGQPYFDFDSTRTLPRMQHEYPTWTASIGNVPGVWWLYVYINGVYRTARPFRVSNYPAGLPEVAFHGLPSGAVQATYDDVTAAGYQPAWIDGYASGGGSKFNLVFRPNDGSHRVMRHGLTGSQYQDAFNHWTGRGYRPIHVDTYRQGGGVRYAVLFTNAPGPNPLAYHGASTSTHNAMANAYGAIGYCPIAAPVVSVGGTRLVTALYAPRSNCYAHHAVPAAQYQTVYDDQLAAGRRLHYLNAYVHGGAVYYSVVFHSGTYGDATATHGVSGAAYQSTWNVNAASGYLTRLVTGVSYFGDRFAGLWTTQ